jgi:hypothetical protein
VVTHAAAPRRRRWWHFWRKKGVVADESLGISGALDGASLPLPPETGASSPDSAASDAPAEDAPAAPAAPSSAATDSDDADADALRVVEPESAWDAAGAAAAAAGVGEVGSFRCATTLYECLDAFFAPHRTEREVAPADALPAGSGAAPASAPFREIGISRLWLLPPLPPVLVFQLKRFDMAPVGSPVRGGAPSGAPSTPAPPAPVKPAPKPAGKKATTPLEYRKLGHGVDFPLTGLDLGRYVAPLHILSEAAAAERSPAASLAGGSVYDLYAVVCHDGDSTDNGHYVAVVKYGATDHLDAEGDASKGAAATGSDAGADDAEDERHAGAHAQDLAQSERLRGQWLLFDDQQVLTVDKSAMRGSVVMSQAYLLFYVQRKGPAAP